MTQSSTPHKKLNLLQVYRGIAAVLVIMFHLNQRSGERLNQVTFFNLFQAGWSGVDYFFVLSGFIMVYVHRSAIQGKRILSITRGFSTADSALWLFIENGFSTCSAFISSQTLYMVI